MKSRIKITSIMLLFALAMSLMPALTLPSQASAAVCYQAQFIADVTVPDGSKYDPNTAFKKTWRLKNIGTCTWNDVSTVFDSGAQMGAPASVPIATGVAPGQTVDVSVDMKAPATAGHYIGYWKFKSAAGTIFGIGITASKSWWVDINVVGGTTSNAVYDFVTSAPSATWSSGAGGLTFPGTEGDAKGFALKKDKPKYESGVESTQAGLLLVPQNITNGFIQGRYTAFKVESGDKFQATIGCESGATTCYVTYRLDYEVGSSIKTFWSFREKFEGLTYNANVDLSPLAGQEVKFILYISAYGSPAGDRALWGNPVIVRKGSPPPPTVTGTPPTATPTKTPSPATATVPASACDKVQFVADVNIPDGTTMQPGAQFTKTWRLKNIGTCAWNKDTYLLAFYNGEKMGGPSTAKFPKNVAVGETVDVSVNLIAPSAAGSYRGYWMFKNASGAWFGLGSQGNLPWWVDIKVVGPTVTPGPTPSASGSYGVVLVKQGDGLNIRSDAGVSNPIVSAFSYSANNVTRTGPTKVVDTATWAEVNKPGGGTGWVNSLYLTEYVTSAAFCGDTKVSTLLSDFKTAITTSDGAKFSSLISPIHGLDIYNVWHDGSVNFTGAQAASAFTSTTVVDWGQGPSGSPNVKGTFKDVIQSKLLDVLTNAGYTTACDTPKLGNAAFTFTWPSQYVNIRYYSLHRPASTGSDLDWRTWVAGVEYVNGKPYLFVLMQVFWEP